MNILVKTPIPFPIDATYLAMRDHLPKLVQYMPNIDHVTVIDRKELNADSVYLINKWHASETEIPRVARPFINANKTYWIDKAKWSNTGKEASWSLEMGFMPERVHCTGTTSYHRIDDRNTEMRVQGTLSLDLKGLVPRLLLGKATRGVEKYVRSLIQPNFQKTADALIAYLEAQEQS